MDEQATGVIFGAGSVGRGFLGQLFSESGYEVVFVDIDRSLVKALNQRRSYTLRLADNEDVIDLVIGPVRAVYAEHSDQVASEVAKASLVATAVGARALAAVAVPLAGGFTQRWRAGHTAPVNVIVCENLHDAPDVLREHVRGALPDMFEDFLRERVGFVPAVIARMSPVPTPEHRAADPTLIVAEPYKVLPVDSKAIVGSVPLVVGMEPVSPFDAYVDRKLYIHNAAHAVLGYLGYCRGHVYGYEALDDPWVRPLLDRALDEVGHALGIEYGFESKALQNHVQDLLARFGNRALADPIERLCRDPMRKLAPDDRLVGAARLAEKHNISPEGLAWGIAAALAYDNPGDSHSVALQTMLSQKGLTWTLQEVCGIRERELLANLVCSCYCELKTHQARKDHNGRET